ncbi:MAG TPA: TlpA disulfide reductase family protein [Bryobacteraceae bacterium]|nr:TlpA disulfide reductase family protein [Bryobacteraceae bacterium]
MRTVVALVFAWNLVGQVRPVNPPAPQRPNPSEPVEAFERFVAEHPDDMPTRIALLQRYFNTPEGALPPERVRSARRMHIVWMIEHHPDAPELSRPIAVIDPKGRFADPEGFSEVSKLWWSRAAVPSATPKIIANAIFFFRFRDPAAARDLLEYGLKTNPRDHDLARMRGMLDAIAFIGAADEDPDGNVTAVDGSGTKSPAAVKAREEIESTTSAALAGGAGQFLTQQSGFLTREFVLGDEDPLELAGRWLIHARQLDPENGAWIDGLMQVYQREAAQSLDPHAKVQYLSKALEIADTQPRQMRVLNDRMEAEFDAGDSAAAGKDAEQLLDIITVNPTAGNFDQMIHAAETMLGRVKLAQGNRAEAKHHLMESAKVKLPGAPKMTLAQDLVDAGERDAVLEYLEACRAFWKFDEGRIDHAEKLIRTQSKPDILSPWRPAGLAMVRKSAPAFDLTDLSGKEWKLDQMGAKPVALAFWNIACAACRDELQMLDRIAGPDYVVLAVNDGDDEARMRDFVSKNHIAFPVLEGKDLARKYDADTLPALAVIDRNGDVAAYAVGNVSPDILRAQLARGVAGRPVLAAPVPLDSNRSGECNRVTFAWNPVPAAESYLVEWDVPFETGWLSDHQQGRLGVIPTRETSTSLECSERCEGRWRVYAVSARDGAGRTSEWRDFVCR